MGLYFLVWSTVGLHKGYLTIEGGGAREGKAGPSFSEKHHLGRKHLTKYDLKKDLFKIFVFSLRWAKDCYINIFIYEVIQAYKRN